MSNPSQKDSAVPVIDELQELADGLAEELKRSVAVDDADLRLIVSSTHFDDADRARLNSLVGRRIVGPMLDYVMEAGAQQWRQRTHLKANPGLGIDSDRWCFPLRSKFELLGFMWLIDDGTIASSELDMASETAQQIEEVLAHKTDPAVPADIEAESLILGLLARDQQERERAAADLRDRGYFRHTTALAVLAVHSAREPRARLEDADASTVRRAIGSALQARLKESFAFSATSTDSVLVVGYRKKPSQSELMSLATGLHAEIRRVDAGVADAITIGIGAPVETLVEVRSSFDQGIVATHVARDKEQVAAAWERHPLEGMLRACLKPEVSPALVPPVLRALEGQPQETLHMIATYLKNAGNVNATADHTHLHRTTVYYRLAKFHERTGLDLDDGEVRLLVHLWLTAKDLVTLTD